MGKEIIADYHSSDLISEKNNSYKCFVDVYTDSDDSDERFDSKVCYIARVKNGVLGVVRDEEKKEIPRSSEIYQAIKIELAIYFL